MDILERYDNIYDNLKNETLIMTYKSLKIIAILMIILGLAIIINPSAIPLDILKIWNFNLSDISQGLQASIPLLIWAIIISFILQFFSENQKSGVFSDPKATMKLGLAISAHAGFFEEIVYRWLLFFNFIWLYQALNWLFLGFIEINLVQWINVYLLIPITNFLSFGFLSNLLYHPAGWFIGAALFYSNTSFRNAHISYGLIGWISSWFFGFYMFYIAFNYSLISAIIVHFLYDLLCFSMIALHVKLTKEKIIA